MLRSDYDIDLEIRKIFNEVRNMKMKSHVLSLFVGMAAVCGMAAESLSLDGSWEFRFEEGKCLEQIAVGSEVTAAQAGLAICSEPSRAERVPRDAENMKTKFLCALCDSATLR